MSNHAEHLMVTATFETGNFRFVAYAISEPIARAMLRAAWATHCAQNGDADPAYLDEFYDDVNVALIEFPGATRDGEVIFTGDVNGTDDRPSVQRIIDFANDPRFGFDVGPDNPEFDMEEVCALLHYHLGVQAYVEYTGGGNATIYAGSQVRQLGEAGDSDEDPIYRYPCLAGPGWFTGRIGQPETTERASWNEFYVGPEDDVDVAPAVADYGVTSTRQIAALIALHVTGTAGFDNVEAIGLDATHRGIAPKGA